jgi:4'-phosphopantetheinyl transferase
MSAALDRESPLLAGCLSAVPVGRDVRSSAPAGVHDDPHPSDPAAASSAAVEVWRADLDAAPRELLNLLSPEERARAARLQGVARARWVAGRGVLRALLGRHLERPPEALRFQLGPHGKPALPEGAPRFNVSHSGALAVYAIAPAAVEVGVDVEVLARRPPSREEVALAERVLGAEAAAHLRSLPPAARHAEFLRRWVRHEATLKCLGLGLLDGGSSTGGSRASLAVGPPAASGSMASLDVGSPAPSGISVVSLDVGPPAVAALAVQAAPPEATPVGASPSGPPPSVR